MTVALTALLAAIADAVDDRAYASLLQEGAAALLSDAAGVACITTGGRLR